MLPLGQVDKSADRPAFRQIADQLRIAIMDGSLQPGDRVPSESQLIEHYSLARMTVRQALDELKAEGLVVAEHGRGVFVRDRPTVRRVASDRFRRAHRDAGRAAWIAESVGVGVPSVDEIQVGREVAPDHVATALGLSKRSQVVARRRRYLLDGQPMELADSYVPLTLARGTEIEDVDTGPGGIYARLENAGHRLGDFVEEVTARMPTPEERTRLVLPPGTPVLVVHRVAYDIEGRPIETTDTVKASPSFILEYRFSAD